MQPAPAKSCLWLAATTLVLFPAAPAAAQLLTRAEAIQVLDREVSMTATQPAWCPFVDFGAGSGFDVAEPLAINASATVLAAPPGPECFLLVGSHAQSGFLTPDDELLLRPFCVLPVTIDDIPVLGIPDDVRFAGAHLYVQVYMKNPDVFPDDPIKMSNGLDATVGSTDLPVSYGASSGICASSSPSTLAPSGSAEGRGRGTARRRASIHALPSTCIGWWQRIASLLHSPG